MENETDQFRWTKYLSERYEDCKNSGSLRLMSISFDDGNRICSISCVFHSQTHCMVDYQLSVSLENHLLTRFCQDI